MELLPFLSLAVGIAGFGFGVWEHFATRKIAEIGYQIAQFADFKTPIEFLKDVSKAPIKIRAISSGSKSARDISFRIKTRFPIVSYELDPSELVPKISNNEFRVEIERLNPDQELNLFLTCNGDPATDQIDSIQITHSEGIARQTSLTKSNAK